LVSNLDNEIKPIRTFARAVQYPQSSCGFALATRKDDGVRRTPINDLPTLYLRLMLKMRRLPFKAETALPFGQKFKESDFAIKFSKLVTKYNPN
jgi:hypothetical protein